jgi:RNA polymerase sigma factor (sigma-70 family)
MSSAIKNDAARSYRRQAAKTVKHRLKYIKKTMKEKIALYDPLEFKPVYEQFIQSLQEDDFNAISEIPVHCEEEAYLDDLVKDFLIENAYYALEGKYVRHILMNKLAVSDPNDVALLEIGEFTRERLEKDGLIRLKKFQERAKFKTFLATAVVRLLFDFWRHKKTVVETAVKYGPQLDDLFAPPVDDPFSRLIQIEDEEKKNKAARFLPEILAKLDAKEKLAVKLKYEKNMSISAIGRTLNLTRYKAEQFIMEIESKIAEKVSAKIKNGGNHETP